jgi:hypothetical protein
MEMVTKVKLRNMLAVQLPEIEVRGKGENWEVECPDRRAAVLFRRFCRRNKIAYNGFYTGYGALIARQGPGPQGYEYTCDFGDKASIHHY